jgi:steroid delta-isomerase-like uncharacterized protein
MKREAVVGLLQQHQALLNRHDGAGLAALYAPHATVLSPMFDTVRGREDIRRTFERLFAIYPDYAVKVRDSLSIQEANRAAVFSTVSGTQRLELFGLPPTGQRIEYQTARLFTFADNLITYEQRIYDFRGLLERLEKTRLDRELSLASAVQQTLCRSRHETPHALAVSSSLPCRAIGGDFVEYLDLADGGLGVAVGDVSGKGPAAALVAAMLQGMFSMVARDRPGPAATLRRLNQALCGRGIEPRYATIVYAVIYPDGRLTCSNAGHHPPLLLSGGRVHRLTTGGPLLGVFEQADFPEETWALAPGDSLVAFSDGVTDAVAPDGDDFGLERLIQTADQSRDMDPHTLLDRLIGTVREFCGPVPPTDDVTIAVARYGR